MSNHIIFKLRTFFIFDEVPYLHLQIYPLYSFYFKVQLSKTFECKSVIIFLPNSLNRCFGCSKDLTHWDGSFEYPQHMFWLRNRNNFQITSLIWRPDTIIQGAHVRHKCLSLYDLYIHVFPDFFGEKHLEFVYATVIQKVANETDWLKSFYCILLFHLLFIKT